jgi:hypothetical protein
MNEFLSAAVAWQGLLLAVLIFGFAPGFCLRIIVCMYPKDDVRKRELIAELYDVPTFRRPLWVAQQLETAIFEGLGQRLRSLTARLRTRPDLLLLLATIGWIAGTLANLLPFLVLDLMAALIVAGTADLFQLAILIGVLGGRERGSGGGWPPPQPPPPPHPPVPGPASDRAEVS